MSGIRLLNAHYVREDFLSMGMGAVMRAGARCWIDIFRHPRCSDTCERDRADHTRTGLPQRCSRTDSVIRARCATSRRRSPRPSSAGARQESSLHRYLCVPLPLEVLSLSSVQRGYGAKRFRDYLVRTCVSKRPDPEVAEKAEPQLQFSPLVAEASRRSPIYDPTLLS
jgi:hypothetical protein